MKQAWSDVADGFSELGTLVKARYQTGGANEAPDEGSSAVTALREAFDRLVAAGRELGDRATDIARDEEIKAQAKRAASSLNDALSATVDMIGHEVEDLFKRPKSTDRSEIEQSPPTSGDAVP